MFSKFLLPFLIIFIVLAGCDDIPNGTIDSSIEDFNVLEIDMPGEIIYNDANAKLIVKVRLDNSDNVTSMWCKIRLNDGTLTIAPRVDLKDNGDVSNNNDLQEGDNIFSGHFELTNENPRGIYAVEIYLVTEDEVQKKIAVKNFNYVTFVENVAPVISELSAPDSVVVEDPKSLIRMTLRVDDANGLQDIKNVYFTATRPDGTTNGFKFYMHDSGNESSDGDSQEGDGIFSIIIEVTPQQPKGEYKFNFQAEDRKSELSNTIIHNIVLL
jgi:hypothetical protein